MKFTINNNLRLLTCPLLLAGAVCCSSGNDGDTPAPGPGPDPSPGDGRCSRLRHLGRRQPPVHGGGTRLLEGLDVALPGHDRPLDDLPDRRRFRPGHHRRHVLQPAANVAGRPHGDPPEVLRPRDRSRFQLYPRAYRRLGLLDGRIHLLRPGGHRILRHSRRGEGWHLSGAERDSGDQSRNQDHGFAVVVPQMDEGHGRRPLETLRFVDRRASQSRLLRRLRRVFRAVGDRDGEERIPDLRHHRCRTSR